MKSGHCFLSRIGISVLVLFFFFTLILLNSFTWAQSHGALAEGTLIRLRGTPNTYVIQMGKKCYIPDAETFQSRGYQWSQVIEVDRATLESIVTGLPIASVRPPFQYTPPPKVPGTPSASAPVTATPSPYPSTPPASGPSSYPSPSPGYPSTSSSVFPDGTLVKGSGPQIYLIQNGLRCLIPDLKTLQNLGFNQSNVVTIDNSTLNSIPLGSPISRM